MIERLKKLITRRNAVLLAVLVLFVAAFTQWRAAITRNRSIADEPFQIAGNLYYVGHTGVTAFLLTGPEGHVLIDGGYPEHGPLIEESISELGFDITDVRILLNSHPHSDHAGSLSALQEASGAELWVSREDAAVMTAGGRGDFALGPARFLWFLGLLRFSPPRVDHTFVDGDTIRLGPIELTAHVTAGHTRGCTSWSFPVAVQQDTLLAVSICSLTLFPFVPLSSSVYPEIRADYERSFETLRNLPADIFLGSHTSWFSLHRKHRAQEESDNPAEPFVDPEGYRSFVDRAEQVYLDRLSGQ